MHPTSSMEFGPLRISYDARVLRPRAWTLHQSGWAAELAATAPPGPLLELCCGAGQIGLAAVARTRRRLVCVDVDPVACEYTRLNAELAGLADLLEVRAGLLEDRVGPGEVFAGVIADPPWVPREEIVRYPEDPVTAIDGGPDGSTSPAPASPPPTVTWCRGASPCCRSGPRSRPTSSSPS
jgi:release factor glutamine methyltransferase